MGTILSSWKEIAQYLGKGVRTAQRWEAEYGLPVRRPKNGRHKAVLAIPEEIDAWARLQTCTGREAPCEAEIEHLRKAVTSLQAENAALRFQLNELIAKTGRETPWVYTSRSGGNGDPSPSDDQEAILRKSKLRESPHNGRGRKRPPPEAFTGVARNGTTGSHAQETLFEDVERFLRGR